MLEGSFLCYRQPGLYWASVASHTCTFCSLCSEKRKLKNANRHLRNPHSRLTLHPTPYWAVSENRTHDLFPTKEVLYPWATTAFSVGSFWFMFVVAKENYKRQTANHKWVWSGRPGSNRPPIAWKAIALPNELLPRTYPVKSSIFKVFRFSVINRNLKL